MQYFLKMHDGYLAIWIFCCVISERTTQAGRTPCSSQDAIIFPFHIILHLKDKWHKVIFKTLFRKIFIHIIFTCGKFTETGMSFRQFSIWLLFLETMSNLLFRSLRTFLKISNELVFKIYLLIFFSESQVFSQNVPPALSAFILSTAASPMSPWRSAPDPSHGLVVLEHILFLQLRGEDDRSGEKEQGHVYKEFGPKHKTRDIPVRMQKV